jgi:hypothetical protein
MSALSASFGGQQFRHFVRFVERRPDELPLLGKDAIQLICSPD